MQRTPSYSQANDKVTEMKTLSSVMTHAIKDGYLETYEVTGKGLHAQKADQYFTPEEVSVINFYRFEGESDPGDNSILYAISAGPDGLKGLLVDAYGAYADAKVTAFMQQVDDINKKVVKAEKPAQ